MDIASFCIQKHNQNLNSPLTLLNDTLKLGMLNILHIYNGSSLGIFAISSLGSCYQERGCDFQVNRCCASFVLDKEYIHQLQ